MGLGPEEAEAFARFQEELRRMTVGEHLTTMLQSIAALAVRKMGPMTETAGDRDLAQAKLAIDAFRALLPVLEDSISAEEAGAHRSVLSELQLAYVAVLRQTQNDRPDDRKDDAGPPPNGGEGGAAAQPKGKEDDAGDG